MASIAECPFCGGKVASDQKKCPSCGAANELYVEHKRNLPDAPMSGDFGKTERLFRSSGTLISFETEQQNTLRCG